MVDELERALSKRIGSNTSDDELIKAMSKVISLLLDKVYKEEKLEVKTEDDILMDGMSSRISRKRKFSSLANHLIPSPS